MGMINGKGKDYGVDSRCILERCSYEVTLREQVCLRLASASLADQLQATMLSNWRIYIWSFKGGEKRNLSTGCRRNRCPIQRVRKLGGTYAKIMQHLQRRHCGYHLLVHTFFKPARRRVSVGELFQSGPSCTSSKGASRLSCAA